MQIFKIVFSFPSDKYTGMKLMDPDGKASVYNAGNPGSIPRSGRSSGEGNGSSLQYSYLENPVDRGAWQATVQGAAKSWTRLRSHGGGGRGQVTSSKASTQSKALLGLCVSNGSPKKQSQ